MSAYGTTTTLPDLDGQPLHRWDCRDHHFVHTYDLLRRPTALRLRPASGDDHILHWLRYGIDRPSPPSGTHPLGKLWQVYDSAGLVEHTAYDVDGNLTEQSRTFLDADDEDATWRDADDALPDWFVEFTDSEDPTLARLESTAHTQSWTYDAAGRLLTHTLPDGRDADPTVLTRTYDAGGRLLSLSRNHRGDTTPVDDLTSVTYNARGQRETIGYGNGVTTSFTYDPLTFRLTGLLSVRPNTSPSWPTTLQDLRYVYDPHGNPTWTDDRTIDDQTYGGVLITAQRTYTYDGLDRLVEATGRGHNSDGGSKPEAIDPDIDDTLAHPNDAQAQHNYTRAYTYDLFGNRTSLSHAYNGTVAWTQATPTATGHNRLDSYDVGPSGSFSPTYDNHGNMTEMAHLPLMAYNALDRLAVVSGIAGSTPDRWRYFYDTAGERVRKLLIAGSATVLKERRYLGAAEIYIVWSGSTETELRETVHVHDEAGRVLLVDTDVIGGDEGTADEVKTRFQLADHLGSVSIELDEDGAVVTYEEYFPYGCAAFRGGRSESEVNNKRYRYTGMERDDESGLRYHSQRYYASWLGRWVRPDPVGLSGGTNLLEYSRSTPQRTHDRSGLTPPEEAGTAVTPAPNEPTPTPTPSSAFDVDLGPVPRLLVGPKLTPVPEVPHVQFTTTGEASDVEVRPRDSDNIEEGGTLPPVIRVAAQADLQGVEHGRYKFSLSWTVTADRGRIVAAAEPGAVVHERHHVEGFVRNTEPEVLRRVALTGEIPAPHADSGDLVLRVEPIAFPAEVSIEASSEAAARGELKTRIDTFRGQAGRYLSAMVIAAEALSTHGPNVGTDGNQLGYRVSPGGQIALKENAFQDLFTQSKNEGVAPLWPNWPSAPKF